MSKPTEKVILRVDTKDHGGLWKPTKPAAVDGKNYYYLFKGGNDGDDGDIEWPVGHATATLKVKLKSDHYTIDTVVISPTNGGNTSNFSWEQVSKDAVIITDTNKEAETVEYTIMVNVPHNKGTVACDPTIKNT